jgi:peptidoglycan/xylan/chitin deacetylase (PgdA/CDA1 family)
MIISAAKSVLYHLGALAAYHQLRNRQTLTVLMFHRVLPATECGRLLADPLWTVTAQLFEEILTFVSRHYNLVGLSSVLAARARHTRLPPRALLVSFDDGWRDNLDHALPILRRYGAPAVVFAASDAVQDAQPDWWQDVVLWALRSGRAGITQLCREVDLAHSPESIEAAPDAIALLCRLAALDTGRRNTLLLPLTREFSQAQKGRQMLDPSSLSELAAAEIDIGIHGATHLPLTMLADPAADLKKARTYVEEHVAGLDARSLSFPHGRYDARIVGAARSLGFELQFTSEAIINACPDGYLDTDLIGRIPVFADQIKGVDEGLSAPRLSAWLFLRPRVKLTDNMHNLDSADARH